MFNLSKYILFFALLIPVAQADDILDVQSRIRKGEIKDKSSTVGGFALPRKPQGRKPQPKKKSASKKPIELDENISKVKASTNMPFTEKKPKKKIEKKLSTEGEKSATQTIPEAPKESSATTEEKSTPEKKITTSEKFKKALEEKKSKGDSWTKEGGSGEGRSSDETAQLIKRKAEIEKKLKADSSTHFGSISISQKARMKKELKEINGKLSNSTPLSEDDVLRHTESIIDRVRKSGGLR